jgi:MFS family permease
MPIRPFIRNFPFGIQILLLSHAVFWMAANLLIPFLSIFFIDELHGVTVTEIGIASLIFYLSFGLLEPVVGFFADHIDGLKDEVVFLIFGYGARGLLFILLAFATNVWHLYMFQFFLGAFRAIAGPADKVLFSTYAKGKPTATLWGLDDSLTNIAAAVGSGVGGYFIALYGFREMLIATGLLTIISALMNLPLYPRSSGKKRSLRKLLG